MNLSKLDGFGRINENAVMVNGMRMTPKQARKLKNKQLYIKGSNPMKTKYVRSDQGSPKTVQPNIVPAAKPLTKRAKKKQKIAKYNMGRTETVEEALASRVDIAARKEEGSIPSIGFDRVYVGNDPRQIQGFGRIKYTNKELQGLSLQGFEILQGYALGDADDLEDWNYLLSIEHPDTLQGFPNWVLNGRKERKARQAARKAKRAAKKAARGEKKEARQTKKTTRQTKRQERKAAGQDRRQRRKEVRTAKKEERLRMKTLRKEEKQKRKQQRLDDRKKRQLERQMTKRQKQEEKTKRREGRGQFFQQAADIGRDLLTGGGDFQDYSYMDFMPDEFDSGFIDEMDFMRSMPSEQALQRRDQIMFDEDLDPDAWMDDVDMTIEPEPPFRGKSADQGGGSSMMLPILIGGGLLLASQMGDDKPKKKR